ncbi:zinc-binding dehydrogenase [Tessaracoccus coleopterorum]|uniref:zinc-binding dehydrogenase n=1 Tax=Tessaracoccus coleopterorum TaxID=2714950 RepID=UPI0018D3AD18
MGEDIEVHVSDVSPWRREFAESFGAISHDPADSESIIEVQPDLAFDSSGRQSARELAMRALSQRGALICVGHGEGLTLDVSRDLIAPERAVLGSEYFRFDEMPDNLDALRRNRELLSRIVTHTYDVTEIREAFTAFFSGATGKVVVTQDIA